MSKFTSNFSTVIKEMLDYREAFGLSRERIESTLLGFDCFCASKYSESTVLTKELVFDWLNFKREEKPESLSGAAMSIRHLAKYLIAIGNEAYVLPEGFYPVKSTFSPYIFTDKELSALFTVIDSLPNKQKSTENIVAPVLFRLIYTCGLRPNEGRELLRQNINLNTGELHIVNTKNKKERLVVMSDDMLELSRKYYAKCRTKPSQVADSEYFFPRFDGSAYTTTQVDRLIKRCWAKANPNVLNLPNVRTYDLRHRFASARLNRWLDEGRDLNAMLPYLRAYMGHNHLSDTAYYIHILPENLVKSAGVDWAALEGLVPEVNLWQW